MTRMTCGIIRPISEMGEYPAQHWEKVGDIITEVTASIDLETSLVSSATSSAIIHRTIVRSLAQNDLIICDVSGKNANVMLELGMRLVFNKPILVIKDNITDYSFDTSPIEHLAYPRSLEYQQIKEFQALLRSKLLATLEEVAQEKWEGFLDHFTIKRPDVNETSVPGYEILADEIKDLRDSIQSLSGNNRRLSITGLGEGTRYVSGLPELGPYEIREVFRLNKLDPTKSYEQATALVEKIRALLGVSNVLVDWNGDDTRIVVDIAVRVAREPLELVKRVIRIIDEHFK